MERAPGQKQKTDHLPLGLQDDSGTAGGISSTSASVNRYILQLAQEYCGDCKNSFDELSKIIQVEKREPLWSVSWSITSEVFRAFLLSPSGTLSLGLPLPDLKRQGPEWPHHSASLRCSFWCLAET